jgi:nicotinamidase-related amidase
MPKPFRPDTTALVLIDHQVGTMQLIKTLDLAVVKRLTVAIAKCARLLGMPIILTADQETHIQGPLFPELAAVIPEAYAARIDRPGLVNAWEDSRFVAAIEKTGRKNLLMAGVTTDVCLIFPAISAVEAGFRVQALLDISGSPFAVSEEAARNRMERAGVEFTATNTAIAELVQDWSQGDGAKLLPILFKEILPPIHPVVAMESKEKVHHA